MRMLLFLLANLVLWSTACMAEFIADTDVPLMDGATVVEDESFSFDTPAGQIMTLFVRVNEPAQAVLSFYKTTLEELGWKQESSTQYKRDNDSLVLTVVPMKQGSEAKIQITFPNK